MPGRLLLYRSGAPAPIQINRHQLGSEHACEHQRTAQQAARGKGFTQN